MKLAGSRVVPVALALTLASPVLWPVDLHPVITVTIAAVLGIALCAFAIVRGRESDGSALRIAWPLAALAGWLCLRAIGAAVPQVSFLGTIAQHTGAALWVVAAAWVIGAASVGDRRSLRDSLAVVSVAGALFALLGIHEALTGGARGWGSAAGPFENSASLGNFLAVACLVSVAWYFATRTPVFRAGAAASAVLAAAGILAADSRSGLAGLILGGLAAIAFAISSRSSVRMRLIAWSAPLLGASATALLVAGSTGALGSSARDLVSVVGTDRDAIWASGAQRLPDTWLFGTGPEQFSAWILWSFNEGRLSFNATYDPHNALLGLVLGGGVVAVLLWAGFAARAISASLAVVERSGGARSVAIIAALPVAMMGSALFSWLTPASMVVVAAFAGMLLAEGGRGAVGRARGAAAWRITEPAVLGMLVLGCVATVALGVRATVPQHELVTNAALTPRSYIELYEGWPDPAFASLAIDGFLAEGTDPADARALLGDTDRPASYHVDLALREIFLAQRIVFAEPEEWPRFAEAVERGVQADPGSGIWYTLAAAQADALGRAEDRHAYATAALAFDLTAQDRAYLEDLARR